MKILFIPIYSMRSYVSEKYLVLRCAQFLASYNIAIGIIKDYPNSSIDILIPKGTFDECQKINILKNKIKFVEVNIKDSAIVQRILFDDEVLYNLIKNNNYTIIYNWHTFKTFNIHLSIKVLGKETKLFTFADHLSFINDNRTEIFNSALTTYEMVSLSYSDKILFILPKVLQSVQERFKKLKLKVNNFEILKYSTINLYEIKKNKVFKNKIFTIIIPQRLTDNNRTKVNIILQAVINFSYKYTCRIIITNPSEKFKDIDLSKKFEYINTTRDEYLNFLWQSHCVIFLQDLDLCWSQTALEAKMANCIIVCKKNNLFKYNYKGFISDITIQSVYNKLVEIHNEV